MNKKVVLVAGAILVAAILIYVGSKMWGPTSTSALSSSVEAKVVSIDDSGCIEDGKVSPGETINIRFSLRNLLSAPISVGAVQLSTKQPGVHITGSVASFPTTLGGGGIAIQPMDDPYVFSVDDTVSASALLFLLETPTFITPVVVPNYQNIYACIDELNVIRGVGGADDTLVIRLTICNESCVELTDPAIKILNSNIKLCGDPAFSFTTVKDQDFYDTIPNNQCAVSRSDTCEFRYTVPPGSLSGLQCIHFMAQIYSDAPPTADCSIPATAIHRKSMELCYEIQL